MDSVEVVLAMLLAVVASGWVGRMLPFGVPLPLIQIALGAVISGVLRQGTALEPDIFFLLFLPPLLFLDGWRIPKVGLFRDKGWPIIHTRESHKPDLSDLPPAKRERGHGTLRIGEEGPMGRILVRGEPGNAIIAACAPREGEIVIDKPGKGMFWNTDVHATLDRLGITHLVFAGVTTEVCVQTSMREANDRGFECLVVTDATDSYFPEFKAAAIKMITAQGAIVGWATPLATLREAVG